MISERCCVVGWTPLSQLNHTTEHSKWKYTGYSFVFGSTLTDGGVALDLLCPLDFGFPGNIHLPHNT